ncbi:MAG: sigma-70 family RNA polymerase sigma factor [Planctomycetes bacterium]|nr:sigma-70 family RNA polymerase sigma factor [Planctomycetota bacterium]
MGFQEPKTAPRGAATRVLLELAAQGDSDARGRLLERFEPLLVRCARKHLGRERFAGEGEDLLQVLRMSVAASVGSFRGDSTPSFLAWLKKVLRSRLQDWERGRRSPRRNPGAPVLSLSATDAPEVAASGPTPSRVLLKREEAQRLRQAIERVPPRYRDLLRLLCEKYPSPAEVAAFLKKDPEAARKVVARALAHLRRVLEVGTSGPDGNDVFG